MRNVVKLSSVKSGKSKSARRATWTIRVDGSVFGNLSDRQIACALASQLLCDRKSVKVVDNATRKVVFHLIYGYPQPL